jgi:hypothetical protein
VNRKLGRNYFLSIQAVDDSFVSVQLPLTIEFDAQRSTLGSANVGTIRVYNLSRVNRNLILKNQGGNDYARKVTLQAGYGPGPILPVVLSGTISQCWSVREGNNFISQIEVLDGGRAFADATLQLSPFPENTPQQTVVEEIANSVNQFGVRTGAISSFPGTISRGNSYSGSPMSILNEITNGKAFIDNSVLNILADNDVIGSYGLFLLNSSSGLLNTPIREQQYINIEILFEPMVSCGQQLLLDSSQDENMNGFYKVIGVHHRGMISSAVCGEATTSLKCLKLGQLNKVQQVGSVPSVGGIA